MLQKNLFYVFSKTDIEPEVAAMTNALETPWTAPRLMVQFFDL